MKITLSPVRSDVELTASVSGDAITVNGVELDFSPLLEGDLLPAGAVGSDWIEGIVCRIDGEIHLRLRLPHGANAPHETRFPVAFNDPMTVGDGAVPLPRYDDLPMPEPIIDPVSEEVLL